MIKEFLIDDWYLGGIFFKVNEVEKVVMEKEGELYYYEWEINGNLKNL